MPIEALIFLADLGQSGVLFLSLSAYIPQWTKMMREQDSRGLSIKAWVMWLVSGVLSWFYALVQVYAYQTGYILLVTSTISLGFLAVTVVMILRFREHRADHDMTISQQKTLYSSI